MISIIIPAYNEEKYIENTLQSIEQQTFRDFETIVVANGCTDKTAEIARRFKCSVVMRDEAHVSAARNFGARHANGEILVFLDADTRLAPNALQEINGQFSGQDAVAVLHACPNAPRLLYRIMLETRNLLHLVSIYRGSCGVIVAPAELFRKVGGFDRHMRIKENSKLIKMLASHGRYKVIKGTRAITSMRRYERWGVVRLAWFWLVNDFRVWLLGKDTEYDAVR